MPSFATPRQRSRDDLEDDEDDDVIAEASVAAKRARLNSRVTAPFQEQGTSGLAPDDEVQPQSGVTSANGRHRYQPGAIVRVKLKNFVTYTAVQFFPGPSLNMVIGPNGTGKSTLVCAICLGLGWPTSHLGRAKDISEFVKHGCVEAVIEIELARNPTKDGQNPVFECRIEAEGNKTYFKINGERSSQKQVRSLAQSYSIQIDNLCQFLPQDRVVEFAAMTPVELLRSTQRAVGTQAMLDQHEELKNLRKQQRDIFGASAADLEALQNLEARQKGQETDVARVRERDQVKEQIRRLESLRPFTHYREARTKYGEARQRQNEAENELKELEDSVEPILRAVNDKESYRNKIEKAMDARRKEVAIAERRTDKAFEKTEKTGDEISKLDREKKIEVESAKQNRQEVKRLQGIIHRLDQQTKQAPPENNLKGLNDEIHAKKRRQDELKEQSLSLKEEARDLQNKGQERSTWVAQAESEIGDLESAAGRRKNKLAKVAPECAKAWAWVQQNQDKFEQPVCGPAIVECSMRDQRFASQLETLMQTTDMICLTVSTQNDFWTLNDLVKKGLRLGRVPIRTALGSWNDFRPPVIHEEMKSYGFFDWALKCLEGPEPVLKMLCENAALHKTPVGDKDTSEEDFEQLRQSKISSWVTRQNAYRITRRREYGDSATSTRVQPTRPARIFTDQPVDQLAKRELQRQIAEWGEERNQYHGEIQVRREQLRSLQEEFKALESEIVDLDQQRKTAKEQLDSFAKLPTRRQTQELKLKDVEESIVTSVQNIRNKEKQQNNLALRRTKEALEYADSVEVLQQEHERLCEIEIMLIEAKSDVAVLTDRNRDVKARLEERRREIEIVSRQAADLRREAKRHLEDINAVRAKAEAENDDELLEFFGNVSSQYSPEQLEAEVESEKARLDLMFEGNSRNVLREFENRARQIAELRRRTADCDGKLRDLGEKIKEVRGSWEPELDSLVSRISDSFSYNMRQINCAGEVTVLKDEENFEDWAVQIMVKFREEEELMILDARRQSGGERAVSTIFYLMSLQSMTKSPFRVVDEINQGMDPRNERLVHSRMVAIATGNDEDRFRVRAPHEDGDGTNGDHTRAGGSQYFLITPKLLHNLRYEPGMRVLCIASGERMPKDQGPVDFKKVLAIRRGFKEASGLRG